MAFNYIHDDVAFSILSKLPIKSLKRFQCVHKSWSLLFEDSRFMTKYRNNFLTKTPSYEGDTSLLIGLLNELYSLSGDRFENKLKLNWPNPFSEENANFNIYCFGSANGILCLCYSRYNDYREQRIVLWNLTIEKFKVIPPVSYVDFHHRITLWGFGYDSIADDYKVIRHVKMSPVFQRFWEIYSLRSNSWKKLDVNTSIVPALSGQVYTDGMCHWMCEYYDGREQLRSLVSVDLNKETVSITFVPSCVKPDWTQLTLLNGSIALVSSPKMETTFHISILGEIGVKESWIKLFIVEQPWVGFPIGVVKGKLFIEKRDQEIIWFDLTTKMIKELGLKRNRMNSTITNIIKIIKNSKNLTCTF